MIKNVCTGFVLFRLQSILNSDCLALQTTTALVGGHRNLDTRTSCPMFAGTAERSQK